MLAQGKTSSAKTKRTGSSQLRANLPQKKKKREREENSGSCSCSTTNGPYDLGKFSSSCLLLVFISIKGMD